MKEVIDILRQQLIICKRAMEVSQKESAVLKGKMGQSSLEELVRQLEPLLAGLGTMEKRKQQLLVSMGEETLGAWLLKQPDSAEKRVAEQLLEKLQQQLRHLQQVNGQSQLLLQRNMQYIEYSVNVMTQVSAGTTYTSPKDAEPQLMRGTKMFDKSV